MEFMASLPVFRRTREEVAILLNNVWHSAVVDFVLAPEFSGLKFVWWWGMTPMKEIGSRTTWRGLWIA